MSEQGSTTAPASPCSPGSVAYLHFPGENGQHLYSEGIFVGYRYYDTRKIEPFFPFGFGLSYTDFTYSDLHIDKPVFSDQEQVSVSCSIINTGSRQSKEVVQLYLADRQARLTRPEKELKDFDKNSLDPGQTRKVRFILSARDFSYYDPKQGHWVVESGKFDIMIGKSSREICLRQTVKLQSSQPNFVPLTRDSYIKDFLNDLVARKIFVDFLIKHQLIKPDTPDEIIDGLRNIFVPIEKTLEMFTLGAITEEILDDLLAKVNERKT
jgi:beta-glucosidase